MVFEQGQVPLSCEFSAGLKLFRVQPGSFGKQQQPHWVRVLAQLITILFGCKNIFSKNIIWESKYFTKK